MSLQNHTPEPVGLRVAVVIVNYWSATYLRRCLAALAEQIFLPEKVVVVNNGDRDGAIDFIGEEFPFVELQSTENIGFAAANNLALISASDCDWVALLNPDAFPSRDWLGRLVAAARQCPDAAVFSSRLREADNPQVIDGDGDCYHVSGIAWRSNHGRRTGEAIAGAEVFSPCAAAAMYRRTALLEVNGFDESYFCYFEDVDLGFRLRLRGYRVVHVPEAMVDHVGGGTSKELGDSDFAIYHGHRNLVWTYVKNMPGYLFWIFLPAHLAMNLVALVWFSARGKAGVIWRAKRDAMRGLPRVWSERRRIQRSRKVKPWQILKYLTFSVSR